MTEGAHLYAPDVARLLGCSIRAARRRLASWERRYGAKVVGRDWGGVRQARRYTTEAGIASTRPPTATLRQRLTEPPQWTGNLVERVNTVEDELDAMRGQIRTLTDMVARCLSGVARTGADGRAMRGQDLMVGGEISTSPETRRERGPNRIEARCSTRDTSAAGAQS